MSRFITLALLRCCQCDCQAWAQDVENNSFRRNGIPCKSCVQRQGDLFIIDPDWIPSSAPWVPVFEQRHAVLGELNLSEDHLLPKEAQVKVQKKLFEAWKSEPTVKTTMETLRTQRKLNSEQVNRELRSRWKTAQHVRFGGALWVNIVIAIGKVDATTVQVVNEEIAKRTTNAKGGPQAKKQEGTGGIQHKKSRAKMARETARWAERKLEKMSKQRVGQGELTIQRELVKEQR